MKNYRFWLLVVIILHILAVSRVKEEKHLTLIDPEGRQNDKSGLVSDVEGSDLAGEDKDAIKGVIESDEAFDSFIKKQEENKNVTKIKVVFENSGQDETGEQDKAEEEQTKCDGSEYEGVGVSFRDFVIIDYVAEGYAADKAGIKSNDEVLGYIDHDTPDKFEKGVDFRGTAGKGIDIFIKRDGKVIKFTMVREKICYRRKSTI
jgi:hypothetical protein